MNRSMSHPNSDKPAGFTPGSAPLPRDGKASDAELPLSSADERAPDAIDVANEQVARGELGAALATLRGLLAREPRNTRGRAHMAALLELRGDLEGALGELGKALDTTPDDANLLRAPRLSSTRGRFDMAEADLRKAARVDPASADVQVQLGMLFSRRARWREAIEPLQAAVAVDPDLFDAHYYLGEAFNHIDDLPQALSAYEAAARIQPENGRALKGMGIVLDRLGRPTEAAAAYRRARETAKR